MNRTQGLLALFLVLAGQACAAVEAPRLARDNVLPALPASLQMQAFISGRVEFAVDVGADGKPTDWLVVGYTHKALVNPCVDAVRSWHFSPARVDGVALPSQVEFTINFTVDGIVVSSQMADQMFVRDLSHDGEKLVYRTRYSGELDRTPARVTGSSPKYATRAQQQGVQGKVQVRFYIDENGAVRLPAVDGVAQPYLAQQALAAVRDWKFEPPVSRGEAVLVVANEEFNFGPAN